MTVRSTLLAGAAKDILGVAADNAIPVPHVVFLDARLSSLPKKAMIRARRRRSRDEPIWHSQTTIIRQPLLRNSR